MGELCCDLIVRIAVYSNGNISVIKYGDKAIDPLLIFDMIESGKQSGLKWMNALNECLEKMREDDGTGTGMEIENVDVDVLDVSKFEIDEKDEKEIENEMVN